MSLKLTIGTVLALFITVTVAAPANVRVAQAQAAASVTKVAADNDNGIEGVLQTVWHTTGEINRTGPVKNKNVRQSHLYNIFVSPATNTTWYRPFVHEAIPRSGNGQIQTPGEKNISSTQDGVTLETTVGIDMAWTNFLYSQDMVVQITRRNKSIAQDTQVVVRPTTLGYTVLNIKGAIYIVVPYSDRGSKFSVEFQDDLWTYRALSAGFPEAKYVQNRSASGVNYVQKYDSSMSNMGIEPAHSLMIFASPFPDPALVPSHSANSTYNVTTGLVKSLATVKQSTVYFGPGVYWFTGTNHAILSPSVNWVYLAPGAYVKGAIQYNTTASVIKATGFGVLSGEQYVYQANTAMGYTNDRNDGTSLRMWSGKANAGQKWILSGPTITAAPFHTMNFVGDVDHFTTTVFDYKQVGCFFWQTDGLEVYPGSYHSDIFYHSGGDTMKTYHSDVQVERVLNWKTNKAPVVQMGWTPRNISNIALNDLSVIHGRYLIDDGVAVPALIGSAPNALNVGSHSLANLRYAISNFHVSNLRCEGICPSLLRLNPLENLVDFRVDGVYIDEFAPHNSGIDQSSIAPESGDQEPGGTSDKTVHINLTISDYYVGAERVAFAANNWQADKTGRIDADIIYWGNWTII